MTRIDKALEEAYRVLKKGGRFMCLEFSKVNQEPFRSIYKVYNHNVLPIMGGLIAKDEASYRYLAESIEQFDDQETFLRRLQTAGFVHANYQNLTLGIVAIHSGFKI